MAVFKISEKCFIYDLVLGEFGDPIKCDGCQIPVNNECATLFSAKIKCLSAKNLKKLVKSLNTGCFPSFWKRFFATLLHEIYNISDVCNYKPISKISIILKIFEALITVKFSALLNNNCLPNF